MRFQSARAGSTGGAYLRYLGELFKRHLAGPAAMAEDLSSLRRTAGGFSALQQGRRIDMNAAVRHGRAGR